MTPALRTPGISSIHRPASKHSVPTETHNVFQGVMGVRDQGTCVLIIPDGQGGSQGTRRAVLTLEESGPRAEPPEMKGRCGCAGALTLFWKDPLTLRIFLLQKPPVLTTQDSSWQGTSWHVTAALCPWGLPACPEGLPSGPGPCRVLFSGTGTRSSGEHNPQGV